MLRFSCVMLLWMLLIFISYHVSNSIDATTILKQRQLEGSLTSIHGKEQSTSSTPAQWDNLIDSLHDHLFDSLQSAISDVTHPLVNSSPLFSYWPERRLAKGKQKKGVEDVGVLTALKDPLQDVFHSVDAVTSIADSSIQLTSSKRKTKVSTAAAASEETELQWRNRERDKKSNNSSTRRNGLHYGKNDDDEEVIAGARLVSGSFRIVSNTAGFFADTVRISGNTAAGLIGSSVRVMGTAVKTVGAGFHGASNLLRDDRLDVNYDERGGDDGTLLRNKNILTSSRRLRMIRSDRNQRRETEYVGLLPSTRRVAAKSVRLVGSLIGGVGESLLMIGSAAETLTSSTVGVAEDTVRIVQNFAGSISLATSIEEKLGPRNQQQHNHPVGDKSRHKETPVLPPDANNNNSSKSFLSYGSYGKQSVETIKEEIPLMQLLADFCEFLLSETEGVPSIAGEIFTVLLLCYLTSIIILSHPTSDRACSEQDAFSSARQVRRLGKNNDPIVNNDEKDMSPMSSTATLCISKERKTATIQESRVRVVVLLPFFLFQKIPHRFFTVMINRKSLLLIVHGIAFVYLCRASQLAALSIQRRAEASGFRDALQSDKDSSTDITVESVMWLNAILNKVWRVDYHRLSQLVKRNEFDYPIFVTRASSEGSYHNIHSKSSNSRKESMNVLPYGGLEPYLASIIGENIIESLESSEASKPHNVAYASLFSFTLGSRPPIIRSIAFRGFRKRTGSCRNDNSVQLDVDLDVILDDLSLILDVKLSSLDYALLPSTRIAIQSVDFHVQMTAKLLFEPDYPFISDLELSLAEVPDCNVRVTPLSADSGLRGVDLGSVPLLRDWIRLAIQQLFLDYVSPKYVSVDVKALLSAGGGPTNESSVHQTSQNKRLLRKKTSMPVVPNSRTSTPDGIAMTSVADKLLSHYSSFQVVGLDKQDAASPPNTRSDLLVRPVTELSRLGMERWLASLEVEVVKRRESSPRTLGNVLKRQLAKFAAVKNPFVGMIERSP